MGKFIDLTGQKFGKLTVISRAENKNNSVCWFCKCDCGNYTVVRGDALRQGKTTSCKCIHKEVVKKLCKKNFIKHGLSKSRLNNIWFNIKQRCYNSKNLDFKYYGAKNIKICSDWEDFELFYHWAINNGYKENLTIDRINVNGNYEPSNCRWVNQKVQQNNRSNNHLITYKDETHSITEWAEIKDINISTLCMRLNAYKWSIEKALNTPVRK